MRDPIERVGSLAAPARARVYGVVAAAYPDWMSRDEAAAAAGMGRSLAAFHLDKLAQAGLVEVSWRRLGARRGPGAGRPAKLYRRAGGAIELSLPPRDYRLAAELLVQALEAGGSREALLEAARTAAANGGAEELLQELRRRGYEPSESEGAIRLRNCPFDALAERHRDVVCQMNLALIEGVTAAARPPRFAASLEPEPGYCCVVLRRTAGEE